MHLSPGHPTPPEGAWAQHAAAALGAALDAVLAVDGSGRLIGLNDAAAALFGTTVEERLGQPASALLRDADGGRGLLEDVDRALSEARPAPRRVERSVLDRHGHAHSVEATVLVSDVGEQRAAILMLRDVSEARRTERRRQVEHRLARTLAIGRSTEEVAQEVLEMLGAGLEFDHAELWIGDEQEKLRLRGAWRRHSDGAFAAAARGLLLTRGEDLAGLALEVRETVCVDDAATLEDMVRADALKADDIHGCAALPIRNSQAVIGVLVLARRSSEPLDPELRQTLHSVAVQLGHFAERRAAERRLAEETIALAAVARVTRRLTDAVDIPTAARAICSAAVDACGATHAFLALPDPEHGGLIVRAASPAGGEGIHFGPDALGAALRAFQTGHAAYVADDPEAEIASGLLQPIFHDDESLGVLGVGWTKSDPPPPHSTQLLVRLLAAEAGSAISRADLVARLEAAARTDPLTGLANLRAWDEQLTRELATAERSHQPVAIALIDIDGFKAINDRLGHQAGDRVLRTSAAAWQGRLRLGDVLARIGGDEFAVLLPSCPPEDAIPLVERLRTATEEATVSIGVACWAGGEPAAALMQRADAALYAAKAGGRNRVNAA